MKKWLAGAGAIALAIVGLGVTPAYAGGPTTFITTEDSYTSQSSPTNTHATGSLNNNAGPTSERRTYVKFVVSGIPAGATNVTSTLKLFAQASDTGHTFTANQVASTWTEAGLTWNNQPALGTAITTVTGLPNSAYQSWNLGTGYITGNGTYSVAVTTNSTTTRFYNSREAASNKPSLVVTWTDPSSQSPPTVTTGTASNVGTTSATLNGTVNPNGGATTCHFDYGLTNTYGSVTPNDSSPGSGTTTVNVMANLTGLTASTLYHDRLSCFNAGGTATGADSTFTTTAGAPSSVLDNKSFLKCTEVGEWQVSGGGSPTTVDPIATSTRNAGFTCIRIAVADCFVGTTCGTNNHAGTINRADFDLMIQRIRDNLRPTMIWFKLLPTSHDYPDTTTATSFCPPWTGDASGNLNMYKDQVNEIKVAGWTGPIAIEMSNEMYFSCTNGTTGPWDVQSGTNLGGGSVGVSNRVGQHFAATAGPLKTYAQGLGFGEVVVGDDIGVPGGAQWGQSFTADVNGPFGYTWTYSNRWIDEFNNGDKNAGGIVPDFEAWHSYVHSPDNYAAAPYESSLGDPASATDDDQILYSYLRGQISRYRTEVNTIWGTTPGNAIRFSISEGAAGAANSNGTWSGWTTGTRAPDFYAGWLTAMAGDGNLTGTGTRYWEYTVFCDACNASSPGNDYDVIKPDGTLSNYYSTFQNFTP